MQLVPYLTFFGDCEEALQFYAEILSGKVTIVTRWDDPAMKAPEAYRNKILHARVEFDGLTIMASDSPPGRPGTRGSMDTSLSLAMEDQAAASAIFDRLAVGGKVGVPFAKQFWGEWHGNLVDRFGIRWMMNS